MNNNDLHDLAVAYAQAKLIKEQSQDEYDLDNSTEEIRAFLWSYHFALMHLPEEDSELDLSLLC